MTDFLYKVARGQPGRPGLLHQRHLAPLQHFTLSTASSRSKTPLAASKGPSMTSSPPQVPWGDLALNTMTDGPRPKSVRGTKS